MASTAVNFNIERADNAENVEQQKEDLGKGIGISIGVLAIMMACFNICFIIPDLIYAYQGTKCVTSPVDGFSFNLRTWLQVDAYMRIGIIVLLLILAIVACVSLDKGLKLGIVILIIVALYSLFALAWTIIGSVMFWGRLLPKGACENDGPVRSYMYALLIISYVGICCNCLMSSRSKNDGEAGN